MKHKLETQNGANEAHRRLAAENLKRCPLCGAVNARENGECFVCRWGGGFDHDPENVEAGLAELLERCPELAQAILAPPTRLERIRARFRQIISMLGRRHIDVLA